MRNTKADHTAPVLISAETVKHEHFDGVVVLLPFAGNAGKINVQNQQLGKPAHAAADMTVPLQGTLPAVTLYTKCVYAVASWSVTGSHITWAATSGAA